MSSSPNESGQVWGVFWHLKKSVEAVGKHHTGAHRYNHTNPPALLSRSDYCLCPCCYRNRWHSQKWEDDNHLEKKKKLGMQLKIILKAPSQHFGIICLFIRETARSKQQKWKQSFTFQEKSASNSTFPQLSF